MIPLSEETRYRDWTRKKYNDQETFLDTMKIQERIGTSSLYNDKGEYVGSISNPELRAEIVSRFNINPNMSDREKELKDFKRVLEEYDINDHKYLEKVIKRALSIEEKMRSLVSKFKDIAALSDDEIIQDVANNIINKFKSLM